MSGFKDYNGIDCKAIFIIAPATTGLLTRWVSPIALVTYPPPANSKPLQGKLRFSKHVDFASGNSYHGEGLLPTELLRLVLPSLLL